MKLSREPQIYRESPVFVAKLNFSSILEKLDKRSSSKLSKSFSEIDSFTKNKKPNKFPQLKVNENTLLNNIRDIKYKKSSISQSYQNVRYIGRGKLTKILSKEFNCKTKPQNQSFCCSVTGKNICTPSFEEVSSVNISMTSIKETTPYKEEFYKGKFKLPKLNSKSRAVISNMLSRSYIASNSPNKAKRIAKSKLISKDTQISRDESISETVLLPTKPETPYIRFKYKTMKPTLPFSIKMKRPESQQSEFPSPLTPFGERDFEEMQEFVV